jgi:predicted nucleic acid-binding protein
MGRLTFVDSDVLIAAATGRGDLAAQALSILDDPERTFASSPFVELEVLPKAQFGRRQEEVEFYRTFFAAVTSWPTISEQLTTRAMEEAAGAGLNAMDALHVASARSVQAEELVTGERPNRPLMRVRSIAIRSLRQG